MSADVVFAGDPTSLAHDNIYTCHLPLFYNLHFELFTFNIGIAVPLANRGSTFYNFIKVCDFETRLSIKRSLEEDMAECKADLERLNQKHQGNLKLFTR